MGKRNEARSISTRFMAWILLAGLVGGIIGADLMLSPQTFNGTGNVFVGDPQEKNGLVGLVQQASPSVVSITGSSKDEQIYGSGFAVSSDGLFLTNAHVISTPDVQYQLVTRDKKKYPVSVVYKDTKYDIAVLHAPVMLHPLVLGDSDSLKVGQQVISIGNPYGLLSNTVSEGIVSGVNRHVAIEDDTGGEENLPNLIQLDMSLNPGESGGPLISSSGHVVGIDTASAPNAEGLSFAIPSNIAKDVLQTAMAKKSNI